MELEITAVEFHHIKKHSHEVNSGKLCLLDIRELWEAETAAISDSHLIPMGDLPARAHQELDKEAHIVVYCHHGHRSLSVVMWLRDQGFPHSQSLAGGIEAWSQLVDPSIPRY